MSNSFFKRHDAAFANYWPGLVAQINNCLFGDAVGSLARREVSTTITPAGRRRHRTEGTSLSAESVVNGGLNLNTDGGATSLAITVTIADAVFSLTNGNQHSFVADLPVAFTTTGSLPNGLSIDVTYYVLADGLTDRAFRISTSLGGAAVSLRGSQSGVHSIYLVRIFAVGDQILNSNVIAGGSPGWVCTTAGPALGVAVFKAMANVAA
jgi:hypothetical protein